jgi:MFS family permease
MRNVNLITFLNFFVSGAVTLLIPLFLLARNVSLAEIGVVVSVLPLVFLVSRLFFAGVADRIGWSNVFLLANSPATLVSTAIYFLANSTPVFLIGKVAEGFREASYWSVNRTAIFHFSPKREGDEATRTNAIIWLSTAVGSAVAGVGIAYGGFSLTLVFLMFASALLFFPAGLLWRAGKTSLKPKAQSLFEMFDPRGKGRTFWAGSLVLMFNGLALYPLITLLLPVFMDQQLGYDYVLIGLLFTFFNLVAAATTLLSLKLALSTKRAVIVAASGFAVLLVLANSGLFFPVLLCVLAFLRGFSIAFFEHVVANVVKNSRNVSVDIGLLHVPMRLASFVSVLAAGFLVQLVGYTPVFALLGLFFVFFALFSVYVLKMK